MGLMNWQRPVRGSFKVNKEGEVVPAKAGLPALPAPTALAVVMKSPMSDEPIGPTRVFEWLLVDIRIGKKVLKDTRLYQICEDLVAKRAAGLEKGTATFVIDLLHASEEDRQFLLNRANWPS